MSTTEPPDPAAELVEQQRIAAMLAVRFLAAVAGRTGTTITDVTCLGALDKNGPMSPGELARLTGLSRGGAITAVVDRLEKAGFVHRRRDGADRRRVLVELLRDGPYADCAEIFDSLNRSYSTIAREYSPANQRRLLDFTLRTNELLDARTEQLRDD